VTKKENDYAQRMRMRDEADKAHDARTRRILGEKLYQQKKNEAKAKEAAKPSVKEVIKNPGKFAGDVDSRVQEGLGKEREKENKAAAKEAAGMEKAKAEQKARHEANKGVAPKNPDDLANPKKAAEAAQNQNGGQRTDEEWRAMGEDPKDHQGTQAHDPGDTDGDGVEVSSEKGNNKPGDPIVPEEEKKDPFADTKEAWQKLTEVFGEKVSKLQTELEANLGQALEPTDRELNNPYAGDDVPESKEMRLDDVKTTLNSTKDTAEKVGRDLGTVGKAAAGTAGTAAKDAGNAIVDALDIDTEAAKSTGKTLAGLSGLFSRSDNENSKVPDSGWNPKSITDLFKDN
jgi:hypothetical protein